MKKTLLLFLTVGMGQVLSAQESFTQLYSSTFNGDKVSLLNNRLGNPDMYGFGVESATLHYKSAVRHRWYSGQNADGGTSAKMELDSDALYLNTLLRSNNKLSLLANSSSLGDIISLYGNRLGLINMYGFGIETNGGTLYSKATTGYHWYLSKNADMGVNAVMRLKAEGLFVKNKISAAEIRVEVQNPPDYVFCKEYDLASLEEIKKFIDKNHHLPEVPSAKVMVKDGVELGEMNMILLKKIEELTLYQIDLLEKLSQYQADLKEMKDRIMLLEKNL